MRLPSRYILLLPLVASSCTEPASTREWQGQVRDSAGVTIVENPAEPLSPDAYTVREVLRIGTAEGSPETQFGLIASIDVAPDGRILVLDQQHHVVRVFGPDGTFVREMGAEGQGPGELSDLAIAVMLGPDDTVYVGDVGNVRITRFAADGEAAGSTPLYVPSGTMPNRIDMLEDGRFVQVVRTVPTPRSPELRDELLLVLGQDGEVEDTLHKLPAGRSIEFRGGQPVLSVFAPEPVWALGEGDRLYTATSSEYRIEMRADGRLERVIMRDQPPRPVTEEDRSAFLRMLRSTLREQGVDPMMIEQMAESMVFAEHYPKFAHFIPGPRGTLWVQHVRTAEDAQAEGTGYDATEVGSDRWDVFDAEGRFVTMARLPASFTPLLHRGDTFFGTWEDDLDVQHVMAIEVLPAAG